MDSFDLYQDISTRTGGEIYIGVVGPVRTGKSTFIKRFMDLLVLPAMEDEYVKNQTRDELPQSAAGKTIMTTEPKFIPKEAAKVKLSDDIEVKMRLIDCVGFMVEGAQGHVENQTERMVKTPWFDYEIPFSQAAEIGTEKVINDHATIGMVIAADGSFGDIPKENYRPALEKTVTELKLLGKPFVIILNSNRPYSQETRDLVREMEKEYQSTVIPLNCEQLKLEDIRKILELILMEFPISEIGLSIPKWAEMLPVTHPLKQALLQVMKKLMQGVSYMKDITKAAFSQLSDSEYITEIRMESMNMADGSIRLAVSTSDSYYYELLTDLSGTEIRGEYQLVHTLKELSEKKREYEKVASAMESVRRSGYGVVAPSKDEIVLEEPQVIRHGNKFGVKMNAECPSIHLIKANIHTEIAPIVGSEEQANDLIRFIKESAQTQEGGIWDANIFGKSIEEIVDDGIRAKIHVITEESQIKLQESMQKIINDSRGGLICIII
ncbi:MAG: stage IV sporulation protein A [Lachnospiraceae bacterium]|nr:stage IV sporulation protein A [Lachnospiraceae bacterium]